MGTSPGNKAADTTTTAPTSIESNTLLDTVTQAASEAVDDVKTFFGFNDNNHPGQGLEHRSDRANEVARNTEKNKHLNGGTPGGEPGKGNSNAGGNGNNSGNTNPGNGNDGGGNPGDNGGGNGNTGNNGGNTGGGNDPLLSGGEFLYYYHPDHLGSTGHVTDDKGDLYEHITYFPFGETWVQESSNTLQRTPYRFTSKELDEETGLYYFGARYYDPRTSVWQSADPILGQYLGNDSSKLINEGIFNSRNFGLYSYGYNDPINMYDPDGNWSAKAHDKLINNSFKDTLPKEDIKIMQQSSRDFDKRTQAPNQSHMHSMAQKDQSSQDAITARDDFIDETIGQARAELYVGSEGRNGALKKLGEALHPIMDSSSPSHTDGDGNPKVWDFDPLSPSTYDVLGEHSPTDFMGDETSKDITSEIYKSQKVLIIDAYDRVFDEKRVDDK